MFRSVTPSNGGGYGAEHVGRATAETSGDEFAAPHPQPLRDGRPHAGTGYSGASLNYTCTYCTKRPLHGTSHRAK